MAAMGPRLLIVSTNLAVPWLGPTVRSMVQGCASAAVVTTAEPKLKERAHHATLAHEALREAGVPRVEYFDFDQAPAATLADFSCVCLASGNPFYLLERLRETGGDGVIEDLMASNRPVFACGAGALLLGRTLRHVRTFDSSVSDLRCANATALGVLPYSLILQANRWRARFGDYAGRLERARAICGEMVELDDNEALLINGSETVRLAADPAVCASEFTPTLPPRGRKAAGRVGLGALGASDRPVGVGAASGQPA